MTKAKLKHWLALLTTGTLVTVGLTSCTAIASASTRDSGRLDGEGFALRTKHASASGEAAVGAKDTKITLTEETHSFARPSVQDLASIGVPVKLKLGEDEQPRAAIKVRLHVDSSKVSTAGWSNPQTYAVLTQSAGSNTSSLLPATFDSKTGYLTVTTDHLSWFEPVQLVLPSFIDKLSTSVLHAINVEYDPPACVSRESSVTLDGRIYSTSGSWAVDPCLEVVDSKLQVKLFSTTGVPFRVVSTASGSAKPLPGISNSSLVQQAAFDLLFSERGAKFLAPGGELDYTYGPPQPVDISFTQAPAMLYLTALVDALMFLIPEASVAEKVFHTLDSLECMANVVSIAQEVKTLRSAVAGKIAQGFVSCVGTVLMSKSDNVIWTMATAAPSLLVTMALGVVNEMSGHGNFTVRIDLVGSQPVLASASAFGPPPNFSEGFGTVEPELVFNGGDPTGVVENIVWQGWGGSTAIGRGIGCDASQSDSVANCRMKAVRIIASNLGTCEGKRAYEDVGWYFPDNGDATDATAEGSDVRDCRY